MTYLGNHFSCKRCGYCCHGETTVSLNKDDQKRMAETLKMTVEEVTSMYWRVTGDIVQMKTVNGHCVFYDNGCTIHRGRPWRCAQWPLHPSILVDEINFVTIKESCPGIDKEITYQEVCHIIKKLVKSDTDAPLPLTPHRNET